MKKFFAFLLCAIAVLFSACGNEDYSKAVSYRQTVAMYGAEGDVKVSVRAGEKESKARADGKCGSMEKFCVLSVKTPIAGDYTYSFSINGEEKTGALTRERFGNAYSADLGDIDAESLTTVNIICGEERTMVSLDNMMGDLIIDGDTALKIALENVQEERKKEESEGKKREIHIKFINDGNNPSSKYYWYVAFIGEESGYWALLIDPETGDVVAKRT